MRNLRVLTLALSAFLLAIGGQACGGQAVDAVGGWTLDTDAFLDEAIPVMIDSGRVPKEAESIARAQMAKLQMQIELKRDGSFVCSMGLAKTSRYEGTWKQNGSHISLIQTHENGELVADTLNGTVTSERMRVGHMEEGIEMFYILRRSAVATPR